MKRKTPKPDPTDRPKKKRFARVGRPSERNTKTFSLFDEPDSRTTLTFTAKGQTYARHRQNLFRQFSRDTNQQIGD